jgi:hypothetical protein
MIAQQIATEKDVVTAVGHPAAVLAGVALWRWLRGAERRRPRPRRRSATVPAAGSAPAVVHAGARPSAAAR